MVPESNPDEDVLDSLSETSATEADSEDFSSTTDSSFDSSVLFYILARELRDLIAYNLRVAYIHRPPRNLNRFIKKFNANDQHNICDGLTHHTQVSITSQPSG